MDDLDRPKYVVAGRQANGASDRRWVVLTESGEYVTLSRARDPTEAEIQTAESNLRHLGTKGWLAIMSGSRYAPETPTLLEVRALAEPIHPFAAAADAFYRLLEAERRR
jgi:hypothetical protein